MSSCIKSLCALAIVGLFVWVHVDLHSQVVAQIGGAPLTHIGVVVRNVEEATRHFADVMGMSPSKSFSAPMALPDGKTVEVRQATLVLPNIEVAFLQPMAKSGPLYDHLQNVGQSIHHLNFAVTDGIDEKRAFLEQKGGKWNGGTKGASYAFVDFMETLGTTIELGRLKGTYPPPTAPTAVPPGEPAPLYRRAVSHVGFAVGNVEKAAQAFSEILGIPAPKISDYKDSQYPPGHRWNKDAYLRVTSWKQANVGIELISSVGRPTPWSDHLDRLKGNTPQHLAIPVGPRMREVIAELQEKGGKWTNGKEGGNYAYLDFTDSFGLVFEITGTAPSEKPASSVPRN